MNSEQQFDLFVEAIYSDPVLEEYRDNPMIEALPPILEKEQAIDGMAVTPAFNEEEKNLGEEYRLHCVMRMNRYFEPLARHIDLEQRMSKVIRQSYIPRDPASKSHIQHLNESYRYLKQGKLYEMPDSQYKKYASGFSLIGFSGIGKSTAMERILSFYPPVIRHTSYQNKHLNVVQLPWIKVDCPFDGSTKGLCFAFFKQLDDILGTNYMDRYGKSKESVDYLMPIMSHITRVYNVGVLVVDEIQHLNTQKSGGEEKMLNFFVTLVNTIGVPVILIGTNKALSILQSEFRQARRGSGQGDMVWDQMANDEMWRFFVGGFWEFQWTKHTTELTEEIVNVLYEESQGILDIAIKVFMLAQMEAITSKRERITIPGLKRVVKENLRLVKPMLDALKQGDVEKISQYEDIRPVNMEECWTEYKEVLDMEQSKSAIRRREREKRNKQYVSLQEELLTKLLQLGVEGKIAEQVVKQILKREDLDQEDKGALVKEAARLALDKEKKQEENKSAATERKRAKKKSANPEDMRHITDEEAQEKHKASSYELLKETGTVKNPMLDSIVSEET